MSTPPSLYIHGCIYFISSRTEEGLPFATIPLVNEILWSIIAKSQQLYGQELIALTIEPNHIHLILRCTDPEKVPAFIGYIKQESAHAINRLLARRKKTLWAEGFDKPIILDYHKFLDRFAYVLLNPWKDQLVPSMKKYLGVASWNLFMNNHTKRKVRLISRSSITALNNPEKAWIESNRALKELYNLNKTNTHVKFNYYSWKNSYPETKNLNDNEARELLLKALADFETKTRPELPSKIKYLDLSKQSLLIPYTPKKHSPKMICLSTFKKLRISFINFFKTKVAQTKEVFEEWKAGNLSVPYPAGMFAPNLPRTQNLVPAFVPY